MAGRQKLNYFDSREQVGARIRRVREQAGLTQSDLARAGCTAAYVSRIEKGERTPSLQLFREFAAILGVSEEFLTFGRGEERPTGAASTVNLAEARVALNLGQLDDARAIADGLLRQSGSDYERAQVTAFFGEIELARGEYREAIEAIELARRLSPEIDTEDVQVGEALGRAYARLLDYGSAIATFTRSLDQAREARNEANQVRFACLLANAHADAGDFQGAENALADAVRLSDRSTDTMTRVRSLWAQSRMHTLRNQPDRAAIYAQRALELLELSNSEYYAALAHQLLAHIESDQGNYERALQLLDHASERILANSGTFERASLHIERARALAGLGRSDEAVTLAMEAAGLMQDESSIDAGRCYILIADVFSGSDDNERAIELYELAVELLRPTPDRYLVEAYSKLAGLLERGGHERRALDVLKEAMQVQQDAGRALSRPSSD